MTTDHSLTPLRLRGLVPTATYSSILYKYAGLISSPPCFLLSSSIQLDPPFVPANIVELPIGIVFEDTACLTIIPPDSVNMDDSMRTPSSLEEKSKEHRNMNVNGNSYRRSCRPIKQTPKVNAAGSWEKLMSQARPYRRSKRRQRKTRSKSTSQLKRQRDRRKN